MGTRSGDFVYYGTPLTLAEAEAWVLSGGDVMCSDQLSAITLKNVVGGGYLHQPHKDQIGYYWHYHPTINSNVHIWFID